MSLRKLIPRAVVEETLGSANLSQFPTMADRQAWEQVATTDRDEILSTAERLAAQPWPVLLASEYARFNTEGDRVGYEALYFERRMRLTASVLAAALTQDERWIADAVDGIWLICEETAWAIPAHAAAAHSRGSALPAPDDHDLDLFCAETGALLAWADYLLGPALDAYASTVRIRLRADVITRVLDPFRVRRDWRWLVDFTNNWNPWIHANVLTCALLLDLPADQRIEIIDHAVVGLDRFLDSYPDDGGCDEGATYWGRAAGALADCLALLYDASGGAANGFDHPKVGPMAAYFPAMHIADHWYVNFADGPAKSADRSVSYPLVRLGRHTSRAEVVRHGQFVNAMAAGKPDLVGRIVSIGRILGILFTPELAAPAQLQSNTAVPGSLAQVLLPDTEIFVAREQPGSTDGLFLAIKGGHNEECHNHNDVGSFVLALDGVPRVVDIGVGTYTRQTFSADRYSIFTMRSEFHNLPTINGYTQPSGRAFRATAMTADLDSLSCSMDLATAYPPEADIAEWRRTVIMDRASGSVTLGDYWQLQGAPEDLQWHLIIFGETTISGDEVVVAGSPGARSLKINFEADRLDCAADPIVLTDPKLSTIWGPELTRLIFTARNPAGSDTGAAQWVFGT